MKKTFKRLLACVAVVMMVFAFCTTAFANTPKQYSGSCNNNFFTSTSDYDTTCKVGRDNNDAASYNSISSTDYTSRAYKNGQTNSSYAAMPVLKMSHNVTKYGDITNRPDNHQYWFKFSNSHSGYKLTVEGWWRVLIL